MGRITLDCETRSELSVLDVGGWRYSRHPSTEVMCLCWRFRGDGDSAWEEATGLWHMHHGYKIGRLEETLAKALELLGSTKKPELRLARMDTVERIRRDIRDLKGTPAPTDLFALIAEGHEVEAHNSAFERAIWENILTPKLGWPTVGDEQWRCSAAKASMHAIPRDLERATLEMCPHEAKDMAGKAVMLKLSRPAPPTKAEPGRRWHEEPDDLRTLWAYCAQDVRSEEALSLSLQDLPPRELELWRLDQRMNRRGWRADLRLADRALKLREGLLSRLDEEVRAHTEGQVWEATSRNEVLSWLSRNGVPGEELVSNRGTTDSLAKEAVERAKVRFRGRVDPAVFKVLAAVGAASKSSIAKYQAMLDRADPGDWRVRDLLLYHGAGTGRWAGRGLQIHNFPRGGVKLMELICQVLLDEELEYMVRAYWTPTQLMGILSDCLRGALTATPGRRLFVADYAAIEARVVFWLADEIAALDVFRAGKDIYIDMASDIYKLAYELILKDSEHRRMGKQAILGLGYQMGAPKFWDTIAGYEPAYKTVVQDLSLGPAGKRDHHIPMEPGDVMIARCRGLGEEVDDKIRFGRPLDDGERRALLMREMNLRGDDARDLLRYFLFVRDVVNTYRDKYPAVKAMWGEQNDACVQAVKTKRRVDCGKIVWWHKDDFLRCRLPSGRDLFYRRPVVRTNKFGKDAVFYWSLDTQTNQWRLTGTYGGKVVENQTQGTARDFMAHGMRNVDAHPDYDLLGSIHDEGIAEADEGRGDLGEYVALLTDKPKWGLDCPIEAEGWTGFRYRKA